jgi:hypothetical protein
MGPTFHMPHQALWRASFAAINNHAESWSACAEKAAGVGIASQHMYFGEGAADGGATRVDEEVYEQQIRPWRIFKTPCCTMRYATFKRIVQASHGPRLSPLSLKIVDDLLLKLMIMTRFPADSLSLQVLLAYPSVLVLSHMNYKLRYPRITTALFNALIYAAPTAAVYSLKSNRHEIYALSAFGCVVLSIAAEGARQMTWCSMQGSACHRWRRMMLTSRQSTRQPLMTHTLLLRCGTGSELSQPAALWRCLVPCGTSASWMYRPLGSLYLTLCLVPVLMLNKPIVVRDLRSINLCPPFGLCLGCGQRQTSCATQGS